MFLSIVTYDGGRKRIIPLSEIREIDPGKYADQTVLRLHSGASVSWRMPYDQAQDVILDCAAQVTAPIASRITGLDNTVARLARSVEDWLELANTPIINCDGMTQEEAERFKTAMNETRATLDSIQPRLVAGGSPGKPQHFVGLDSDVFNVVQLLNSREWAEHCTTTQLGQRLESAITDLHNMAQGLRQRRDRAEELLAEVWHEWNNDDATRKALGEDMGKVIGNFLWPDENKTCEKE